MRGYQSNHKISTTGRTVEIEEICSQDICITGWQVLLHDTMKYVDLNPDVLLFKYITILSLKTSQQPVLLRTIVSYYL